MLGRGIPATLCSNLIQILCQMVRNPGGGVGGQVHLLYTKQKKRAKKRLTLENFVWPLLKYLKCGTMKKERTLRINWKRITARLFLVILLAFYLRSTLYFFKSIVRQIPVL